MELFHPAKIGNCTLKNRIVRSATFEGMCDADGFPTPVYKKLYETLAEHLLQAYNKYISSYSDR